MICQNGLMCSRKRWTKASILQAAGRREPNIPEARPREESGKHNVSTHFLKDRNSKVRRRTKISRALCRKRTGNHLDQTRDNPSDDLDENEFDKFSTGKLVA